MVHAVNSFWRSKAHSWSLFVSFKLGLFRYAVNLTTTQAGDGRDFICGPDGTLRKVLLHGGPELYESLAEAALKVHCVTAPRLL